MAPSICLAMICKNESEVIRRALSSCRPYINTWVVLDTGSTDGTQDIIREEMAGLPGQIIEEPWVNWETSRTRAIQLGLMSGTDFVLIMDADEKFMVPEGWAWPEDMSRDKAYWVTIQYNTMMYTRPSVISPLHNWHYVGVTHEYLTAHPDDPPIVTLPIRLETYHTRTNKPVSKCLEDVRLLEEALEKEPGNSRYQFYLAQSYRDSMQLEKAIEAYTKRATMGGWYEEVWYSLFQIGEIKVKLNAPEPEIMYAYLIAYEYNPRRSEPLGALARYLRLRQKFRTSLIFSEMALRIPIPNEMLFLETIYYQWLNLDEFSVCAYWTGRYQEAIKASDILLQVAPPDQHERIKKNREFSLAKLAEIESKNSVKT